MKIINIGIIAHVDAGKTTLTEQMLAASGVVASAGRVDHGSTVTDALALERKRGISIKATPVSFFYRDVKFNLIDTPGHVDFIAEVERSLSVLDGVVLVVSAREGVQTQTRLFIKVIRDLKLPCVIFINKADRIGADTARVCDILGKAFSKHVVRLQNLSGEGTRVLTCAPRAYRDVYTEASDWLCDLDDALMHCYVSDLPVSDELILSSLTTLARHAKIYPLFMGSALQGVGVTELMDALTCFLPLTEGCADAPLSSVVFKVDARSAERASYVRLYQGTIRLRDRIMYNGNPEKVTRLRLLENGKIVQGAQASAGDVCILSMKDLQVADIIGVTPEAARSVSLAKPALSVQVEPVDPANQRRLFEALTLMASEDPMIDLDLQDGATYLHLFGEVQMDILQTMLSEEHGIAVRFSNIRPIYKETPASRGEAAVELGRSHFKAGVGFYVEPRPRDAGLQYRSDVWLGSLEKPFQNAVEEAVYNYCKRSPRGLPVTDVQVVFNFSQYDSVTSTPSDFRHLTPMVLDAAFKDAGLRILEPLMDFELICPETSAGKALFDCRRMDAAIKDTTVSDGEFTINGRVPFENCRSFPLELASYTEGQGVFITRLHGYREKP